jgi:hypothetical protein
VPDQRHPAADAVEPLAQGGRGGDDQGLERHHGLGARLDRGVARGLEVADHLRRARARLGQAGRLPAQHGAGGGLSVERVALALPAPELAAGAIHLKNRVPPLPQEAGQPGAVGARALDAEGPDGPERPRPGLQLPVTVGADQDGRGAQAGAARVDRHGGVDVFVGVDADDDLVRWGLAHGGGSRPVAGPDGRTGRTGL